VNLTVGDRFEKRFTFARDDIVDFARLVEDWNPIHHDAEFASATRFGGLIASGAHTVAYLMAFCAAETTRSGPGVGLEFTFRLVGPAKPDEELTFCWEVTGIEPSERPLGRLVALRGAVTAPGGRTVVEASATVLSVDRL
jgi:acyl dehydratase